MSAAADSKSCCGELPRPWLSAMERKALVRISAGRSWFRQIALEPTLIQHTDAYGCILTFAPLASSQ